MGKLIYRIGKLTEKEQYRLDFEDALGRSVRERIEFGFIPLKLPIIDEEPYRVFNTMEDYRKWAADLPKWLGYDRLDD